MENKESKIKMLDDEELEQVSGGNVTELLDDAAALYRHGMLQKPITLNDLVFKWDESVKMIVSAWRKSGITCVPDKVNGNRYYNGGVPITRAEIYKDVKD